MRPAAVEPASCQTQFPIDAELCARARDELIRVLESRDQKRAARFDVFADAVFRTKFQRIGRIVVATLTSIGFAICAASLAIYSYGGWWQRPELPLMVVLAALGSFAWFVVPSLSERLYLRTAGFRERLLAWSTRYSAATCQKAADRIMKFASAIAPYEAQYSLVDTTLQSVRVKNGTSTLAWKRDLDAYRAKGLSVSGETMTVIFRRTGSLLPSACILHRDPAWIRGVLAQFEIPIRIHGQDV